MTIKEFAINTPEWFDFVDAHPESNIFHHPAWASLIGECYGYEPFVSAKLDDFGRIDVGIPFIDVKSLLTGHRWVAMPFSDHCKPLFRDYLALDTWLENLSFRCSQKIIPRVEIRASLPPRNTIHQDNSFVWHTVKLENDPEAILRTFNKSRVREPIRQSTKRGTEVRWCSTKKEMNIFYDLLVETRRRLGAPVQPKRFFDLLWKRIIEKKLGFLLLAYKGSEPVAGAIFLYYKKMLSAKYNASLPEYWKIKANDLLYWSAIKWGCENKFNIFDFGRTEAANQGLGEFKMGWNAEVQVLSYSSISNRTALARTRGLNNLVKKIIRKSPLWICRLSGELMYKHIA